MPHLGGVTAPKEDEARRKRSSFTKRLCPRLEESHLGTNASARTDLERGVDEEKGGIHS